MDLTNSNFHIPTRISTVLLDYDGVCGNTEGDALRKLTDVLNEMIESKGSNDILEYDYVVRNLTGRTCRDILAEVAKDRGIELTPDEVDRWVARELEANIEGFMNEVKLTPGIMPAMYQMWQSNLDLAVVSSSDIRRLVACLGTTGQSQFIPHDHVFSAQSSLPTPTPKPDPACYLHAIEKLGKRPEECLAVEDSRSGATAAVRAGLLLVGFVGAEPQERHNERAEMLFKCGARWVVADMTHVPSIIGRLSEGLISELDAVFGKAAWGLE